MSYHFQVHLRGIIDLLSYHLYSGPHVFIRELLQNGSDAIRARQKEEPFLEGRIDIQLSTGEDGQPPTILFEDNGIGLTEEEVHRFLSTIGESSKRHNLLEHRADFIGQFGIGLLSCFMVADEIVMITRSARSSHPPVEWRGRADGTYSIRALDPEVDVSPGTRVYLRANSQQMEWFAYEKITELAQHYGSLLPIPIVVSMRDRLTPINPERPPWEQAYLNPIEEREAYLRYGRQLFDLPFQSYFPLRTEAGGITGIAYVLPYATNPSTRGQHRVYLKGMLLSDQVEDLLPRWAMFVRCVIHATNLRPVASREGLYEDEELSAAREALGEALRMQLIQMAQTDREAFGQLIAWHHTSIRSLAAHDEECFRVFADLLPFETSLGHMTLGEYKSRYSRLVYTQTRDEFRQIAQVAGAQGICVINAGYLYDHELLQRLAETDSTVTVERLSAADLTRQLDELTLTERDGSFDLLRLADMTLQPYHCRSDIKKFEPSALPTLYTHSADYGWFRQTEQTKNVSRSMWEGILDAVSLDLPKADTATLCFNYNNPLIQRLITLRNPELQKRTIEMLYIQALLMGHHPLSNQEMKLLNEGLLGLIDSVLDKELPDYE